MKHKLNDGFINLPIPYLILSAVPKLVRELNRTEVEILKLKVINYFTSKDEITPLCIDLTNVIINADVISMLYLANRRQKVHFGESLHVIVPEEKGTSKIIFDLAQTQTMAVYNSITDFTIKKTSQNN